jgi:hypothetical protein
VVIRPVFQLVGYRPLETTDLAFTGMLLVTGHWHVSSFLRVFLHDYEPANSARKRRRWQWRRYLASANDSPASSGGSKILCLQGLYCIPPYSAVQTPAQASKIKPYTCYVFIKPVYLSFQGNFIKRFENRRPDLYSNLSHIVSYSQLQKWCEVSRTSQRTSSVVWKILLK